MDEVAIRVRDLSKRYRVFESERARLAYAVWPRRGAMREIAALEGVSFDVKRGESFGVIGRNGGGKSTLLQILTGVLRPTGGEVEVKGRVSALLELGSGFHPEYTGRDNVILNGMLLGLKRDEILARFGEIAAFAEIGEAIDRPVKTYSSGMVLRLAYAVQALVDPDILVIDEALSVGDFFFQQKCFGHLRALRSRGVTLVFVSHDMATVRDLCSRALYVRQGRAAFVGETYLAIRQYLAEDHTPQASAAEDARALPSSASSELETIQSDSIWSAGEDVAPGKLIAVALYDEQGQPATAFRLGSTMRIRCAYRAALQATTHVAIAIWNKLNQVVTAISSSSLGINPPESPNGDIIIFDITLALALEAGGYSIMVSLNRLTQPNRADSLDATPQLGPFVVHWDYEQANAPFLGMVGLPAQARFTPLASTGEAA